MGAQAVRLSNVDIDNALKNKDFEVLFQPIFDLGNGALARVETFVRWRHPSLGVLPPGAFISFFESQGRMSELTRYVLAQALAEYRAWRGPSAPGFSINLALSDLTDEAFSSHFAVLLRDSGFPADLITLECPMPPVTMETGQAAEHFHRLSRTGARLAIEVRGRANDFLRTIDPFPFDEIKTGGAAILRFARTVRGPGLSAISELLDIATKANAAITAVGVEDQASLAALRGLGFAAAQGNHLGKVGPLSTFNASRVNEVRGLLGLEPLDADDIAAMFRTEAPAPKQSESPADDTAEIPPTLQEDDLVERLAARLSKQDSDAAPPSAATAGEKRRGKAPSKAAALKAAAIARAKRKAAEAQSADDRKPDETTETATPPAAETSAAETLAAESPADAAPARSLQERLSRAFNAESDEELPSPEEEFEFGSLLDIENQPARATLREGPPIEDLLAHAAPSDDDEALDALVGAEENLDMEALEAVAEEAVAPRAAVNAAPPAPPVKPIDPEGVTRAALAIKGARAYFRPGLRVGISQSNEREPGEYSAPARAPEPERVVIDDTPPEKAPAAAAPKPLDVPPAEEAARAEPPAPTRRRRTKRKNFLNRTVIPYPTHFWPKSWKRAWRRRTSQQGRQRGRDPLAAE